MDFIPLLKDSEGTVASSLEESVLIAQRHFEAILNCPEGSSQAKTEARAELSCHRKKVIPELTAALLDQELTLQEIEKAIEGLQNRKSPGSDGLPAEFFKTFNYLVAKPLLHVWEEAVQYTTLPFSINTGIIKLIHKKGDRDIISNWRPITLLSSAYKIYAKALAARFSSSLNLWLHKEQKGFIKGRQLLEAILALWEGMEHAEDSKHDIIFLKIDFEKAYDRLEWSFIFQALSNMGFGPKFSKYIQTLFENARARVSVNGKLSKPFSLCKSIRQGCPIAPLLFAIAVDGLNCLIHQKIQEGAIKGLSLPNQREQMCLQQFADDTNALVLNKDASLTCFWKCLDTFCLASGSKINHNKTGYRTGKKPPP